MSITLSEIAMEDLTPDSRALAELGVPWSFDVPPPRRSDAALRRAIRASRLTPVAAPSTLQ